MNNDVREAAKRVRLFDAGAGNPYTLGPQASMKANVAFLHDLSKLADAYLAEHPEDDDEPLNYLWLEAIAGDYEFNEIDDYNAWGFGSVCVHYYQSEQLYVVYVDGHRILTEPTKGQMRHLLEAMGEGSSKGISHD